MSTRSLRDYFLFEARHTPRRAPLGIAVGGVASVLLCHLLIPLLPRRAIAFMELGLRLDGMAAVLLANDLIAVYFASFFVGAAGLISAIVTAREERRLEILLAKPIRASTFLTARAAPAFGASLVVGVVVSLASAIGIVPHLEGQSQVTFAGALGGGLFLTGLALFELALLELALVSMRDGFQALLVASIGWLATMTPVATLLYRPDLFDARPGLADALVLSSLIWNDRTFAWLGPLAVIAAVPIAAALIALAASRLERSDAV